MKLPIPDAFACVFGALALILGIALLAGYIALWFGVK